MRPVLSGSASALLLVAALPPFGVPGLVFVALVPLFVAVRAARWQPTSLSVLGVGFVWGLVFFGIQFHWMPGALSDVTALGPVVALCAALLGGLYGALATGTADRWVRWGLPWPLAAALGFVVSEWVRGRMPGLAFPWLGIASGLTGAPVLMAPAAWVGEAGLAAGIVAVNAVLAAGWLAGVACGSDGTRGEQRLHQSPRGAVFGAGVLLIAVALVSAVAWTRPRDAPEPLGSVVPMAVLTTEFGRARDTPLDDRYARLDAMLENVPASARLVLTPEAVLPVAIERRADLRRGLTAHARRLDAILLVGAFGLEQAALTNSVFALEASTAETGPLQRLDKVRRVPFVESGFASGTSSALTLPEGTVGVLLCFESLFSDVARDAVLEGADFLVAPTSEAWFARAGGWAERQHVEHLRLRAAETRRWIVRAANQGRSALVDPSGRLRYGPRGASVWMVEVGVRADHTPFVQWGALLVAPLALVALLGWLPRPSPASRE